MRLTKIEEISVLTTPNELRRIASNMDRRTPELLFDSSNKTAVIFHFNPQLRPIEVKKDEHGYNILTSPDALNDFADKMEQFIANVSTGDCLIVDTFFDVSNSLKLNFVFDQHAK